MNARPTVVAAAFIAVLVITGCGNPRQAYLRIHPASDEREAGWVALPTKGSYAPDPLFTTHDVINERVQIIDELVLDPDSLRARRGEPGVDGRKQLVVILLDGRPAYFAIMQHGGLGDRFLPIADFTWTPAERAALERRL